MRKILFHLPIHTLAISIEQGSKLSVEPVATMALAYEIKNSKAVFVGMMSQPAAKLLEKYSEAFCRAEEHHQIDFRDVYSFAKNIDGENKWDAAGTKIAHQLSTFGRRGLTDDDRRLMACLPKCLSHVTGVLHARTKSDGTCAR